MENTEIMEPLTNHEIVIQKGLKSFVEVGRALMAIKKEKLYKGEYRSFTDYCKERWNLGSSRVYQLINASNVVANLSDGGDDPDAPVDQIGEDPKPINPQHEAQIRPLVGLQPEQQREAWHKAIEISDSVVPTAKEVVKAVDELFPKDKMPKDEEDVEAEEPAASETVILEEGIQGRFQCPECSHEVLVQSVSLQLSLHCQIHEQELALQGIVSE